MQTINETPYFVFEATVALYPADAGGQALTGSPVWLGAVANAIRMTSRIVPIRGGSSGDRFKTVRHVDETHHISFDRLWIVQAAAPSQVFAPVRNQQYVLDIVWLDRGLWHRRTYFGVTGEMAELASRGVLEFNQAQTFDAQYFTTDGGLGNVFTPLNPTTQEQPVGFFHENPVAVGDYLLGAYRWATGVIATTAVARAAASQNVATTLTLEVNGTLTGYAIVLGADAANAPATGQVSMGLALNAGDQVRWKVTAGPDNGIDAAWQLAVVMQVQTTAAVGPVGFFHEDPLAVGDYLLGQYRWGQNVKVTTVRANALAPQNVPVVLGLALDGVLTAVTVTIPAGAANAPVTGQASPGQIIRAGQEARWQCVAGPDNGIDAAWQVSVTMEVQQA